MEQTGRDRTNNKLVELAKEGESKANEVIGSHTIKITIRHDDRCHTDTRNAICNLCHAHNFTHRGVKKRMGHAVKRNRAKYTEEVQKFP